MEKTLKPEDSLEVIREMVSRTKQNLQDGSFYYLLWGWLALSAAAAEYVLMVYVEVPWHPMVWAVMGITGGIASGVYGARSHKKQGYRTFIDSAMKYTWLAFGAMMVVTLMYGFISMDWGVTYAFIIALYGMGTFISGGLLKFRPLIFGGIVCWIISATTLIFHDALLEFPTMLIALMLSLVLGYLIPGYALKNSENRQNAA